MSEQSEIQVDNVIPFPTKEELAKRLEGVNFAEWIFTNDKANPYPRQLLHQFYEGTLTNKIGIMHAKDKETGADALLLVGVLRNEEGDIGCYPLARVLDASEVQNYLAPDGNGGWIGEDVDVDSDEPAE